MTAMIDLWRDVVMAWRLWHLAMVAVAGAVFAVGLLLGAAL